MDEIVEFNPLRGFFKAFCSYLLGRDQPSSGLIRRTEIRVDILLAFTRDRYTVAYYDDLFMAPLHLILGHLVDLNVLHLLLGLDPILQVLLGPFDVTPGEGDLSCRQQ